MVSGGLLAEEMGLGKTVEVLALITSDSSARPRGLTSGTPQLPRGGTLVVVPVSLLAQWQTELLTKAPHLGVYVYHGEGANLRSTRAEHEAGMTPQAKVAQHDVVLTTMSKLMELSQRGAGLDKVMEKVLWHRLVVDECQFLKNDTTAIARAASAVQTTHVWMLSGTPLTNKLDDLQGRFGQLIDWLIDPHVQYNE